MDKYIEQLMDLFDSPGPQHNTVALAKSRGKKQETYLTARNFTVGTDQWKAHLEGAVGIGLHPIFKEGKDSLCKWCCIDIDEYDGDVLDFLNEKTMKFPFIPCYTKSKGLHLFLFFNDWEDSREVFTLLRLLQCHLGLSDYEAFPKQRELGENVSYGNAINIPYFNYEDTVRYALDPVTHQRLSLAEFIEEAKRKRIDLKELEYLKKEVKEDILEGGPPCLNQILSLGEAQEGSRNEFMFAVGVYFRKRKEIDGLKDDQFVYKSMMRINNTLDKPIEDSTEILNLAKSVEDKAYNYPCQKQPLCSHCFKSQCMSKKYGVGSGFLEDQVSLENLTKLVAEPCQWQVLVQHDNSQAELTLNTKELHQVSLFQQQCLEQGSFVPPNYTQKQWAHILNQALREVHEVKLPEDTTERYQVWQALCEWLSDCGAINDIEHLATDNPIIKEYGKQEYYCFKINTCLAMINRKTKMNFSMRKIGILFNELGIEQYKPNVSGHRINARRILVERVVSQDKLPVPDVGGIDAEDYA